MNAQPPSLRLTLNLWEAVGVSVALMASSCSPVPAQHAEPARN
jgi:hypothetical protein